MNAATEFFNRICPHQSLKKAEHIIPMDLLRRLEKEHFPVVLRDVQDIRNATVLVASGLIEAILPHESEAHDFPGVLLRITSSGRAELERIRQTWLSC